MTNLSVAHTSPKSSPHTGPAGVSPLGTPPGYRTMVGLTRAVVRATWRARSSRPLPPRWKRRSVKKLLRQEAGREAHVMRATRAVPLVHRDAARLAAWARSSQAVVRAVHRKGPLPRPRPRAAHRPRGRAAPAAPGRGETAPPEEGGEADDGADDPPRLRPRPARAKRGRPRKRRNFRAYPDFRVWKRRLAQAEAVAALPGAIFATFLPADPPDETSRCLARVPAQVADTFAGLARRLRREPGAAFALAAATRAENGAFFPHAHGIVWGVSPSRLAVLAARSGLKLAYAEPVRNAEAAARYALGGGQKRHYDRVQGTRGFWARVPAEATPAASPAASPPVSLRNIETPLGPLPAVPGPVDLGPGVRVVDTARFLEVNAANAQSPNLRIRAPALDALTAYAQAMGPLPPSTPPPGLEAPKLEGGGV